MKNNIDNNIDANAWLRGHNNDYKLDFQEIKKNTEISREPSPKQHQDPERDTITILSEHWVEK